MQVKLNQGYNGHEAGDVISVDANTMKRLVDRGLASPVEPEKKSKKK